MAQQQDLEVLVAVGAACGGEQVDDEPEEMEQGDPNPGGSVQNGRE